MIYIHLLINHSININWNINDCEKENLNKYYWGYQIIRPDFLNKFNFGIKNLEEKIFITNGCSNNIELHFMFQGRLTI